MRDAAAWLRSLPSELASQRDVIAALLREVEQDARMRIFVVGSSIGRGVADRLSDVDALIIVSARTWDEVIRDSAALARRAGDVVDLYQEVIRTPDGGAYQHTFAQYASGAQLDLVIAPAGDEQRPRHDWVVLYDPDDRVRGTPKTEDATEDLVRKWMNNGLVRLAGCAKYLRRGSLWEARLQLDAARGDLWRLWATAAGVRDPQYGLTAVLDDAARPMPPNIEATIAGTDADSIHSAAIACAQLFIDVWPRAIARVARDGPAPPLAAWVRDQLDPLST